MSLFKLYLQKVLTSLMRDKKRKKALKEQIIQLRTKLGVMYNVFDGLELLEASIKSIRSNVDYITIVYQVVSNFGEQIEDPLPFFQTLKAKGLVDNIIFYETNFKLTPQENEVKKRNIGLKDCIKHKCSYFLNMDADEFYVDEQFKQAKEFIFVNQVTSSVCAMYYYIQRPIYRFVEPRRSFYVPFICKITPSSKIELNAKTFCIVDPTRMITHRKERNWVFAPQALAMHHMAYVRKDLDKKFRNSTCNQFEKDKPRLAKLLKMVVDYQYPNDVSFPNEGLYKVEQVDDVFNVGEALKRDVCVCSD